jgi:SAM-dependent methyltransferase
VTPALPGQSDSEEWARGYLASGERTLREWLAALAAVGRPLEGFASALDWGCGPGRVLGHLLDAAPHLAISGADTDAGSVEWVRQQGTRARLEVIGVDPPMPFDDGEFELVVSHSVLTHLNADDQRAWLAELARVLGVGGVFVTSTHGANAFELGLRDLVRAGNSGAAWVSRFRDDGFLFVDVDGFIGSSHHDRYHTTFQVPESIELLADHAFQLLAVFPRGAMGFQDLLVLERLGLPEREARRELAALRSHVEPARAVDGGGPAAGELADLWRAVNIMKASMNRIGQQVTRLEDLPGGPRRD